MHIADLGGEKQVLGEESRLGETKVWGEEDEGVTEA